MAPGPPRSLPTKAPAGRPNILLFTLDTTRADMLGSYGSSMATPNIDTIARESVVFTRAYTVTPLTIPAHSSLFTGMWPPHHGVEDNGDFFLGPDAHTLAETLSESGYQTMAAVGAEVTSHHWGFDQGFQTFFDDLKAPDGNRWQVERRADLVQADALSWLDQAKPQSALLRLDPLLRSAQPVPRARRLPEPLSRSRLPGGGRLGRPRRRARSSST